MPLSRAPVRTIEITARINSAHNLAANLISYRNAAVRYAQLTGARALQWQKKTSPSRAKTGYSGEETLKLECGFDVDVRSVQRKEGY